MLKGAKTREIKVRDSVAMQEIKVKKSVSVVESDERCRLGCRRPSRAGERELA